MRKPAIVVLSEVRRAREETAQGSLADHLEQSLAIIQDMLGTAAELETEADQLEQHAKALRQRAVVSRSAAEAAHEVIRNVPGLKGVKPTKRRKERSR